MMQKLIIFLIYSSVIFCLSCNENELSIKYHDLNNSYSNVETDVCTPCENNKKICSTSIKCLDGYYKLVNESESNKEYCQQNLTKTVDNCAKETKNGETINCKTCESDYWLDNNYHCQKKSDSFLEKCQAWTSKVSTETCATAKSGYRISEGQFFQCPSFCSVCANGENCTTCVDGYRRSDDNRSCIKNEGNCKLWKQQSTEECQSCEANYTIKGNLCYDSKCQCADGKGPQYPDCSITCSINCKTCSTDTSCTTCLPRFYVKEDNSCGSCSSNCLACSSDSVCSLCEDGYFKDSDACTQCTTGCQICTAADACLLCESSKVLSSGSCITLETPVVNCKKTTDGTTCSQCQDGYYLDTNACTSCGNNCQTCESKTECQTCSQGSFQTTEKQCQACSSNCKSCTSSTACTVCNINYILKVTNSTTSECIPCTENYAKYQDTKCTGTQWKKFPWLCEDNTGNCQLAENDYFIGTVTQLCETCQDGYININKSCQKCDIEHCKDCSAGKDGCVSCEKGYYLNGLECSPCLTNCDYCESAEICLDCATGYTFNNSLTTCIKCQDENCEWCKSADLCSKCKTAYYYNTENLACTQCKDTCQKCYNSDKCYECKDTYFLKDWGCFSCIENCKKCENAALCIECIEGFIPNVAKNECQNETLCMGNSPNCKKCDVLNTVYCYECNEQYYFDNKLCKKCLDNCQICKDADTCQTCTVGYELNLEKTKCNVITINEASCFSLVDGCIQCDSTNFQKCAFCASGSVPTEDGKCVCTEGYKLLSGSCVKQEAKTVDFDSLSSTEIVTLQTYVEQAVYGTQKANNTEKVLKQLKAKLTEVDSTTAQQSAQILLALASTTTNENAQDYYKYILDKICKTEGLESSVYYTSLAATDAFYPIANNTMILDIYELGFTDCVKNYLKIASPKNVPLLKLKNSQFFIKEVILQQNGNIDQAMNFSDASVIATIDFKYYLQEKSSTKKFFIVSQAINNAANPYKYVQNTSRLFESKIISVQVMSKANDEDTNAPVAETIDLKAKLFNITFDFEGTKCGHYEEQEKEWVYDINADGKTCQFNHTTHFVMYQDPVVKETTGAFILGIESVAMLVLLFLLFV